MSKKIDERLPQRMGKNLYPDHPTIKTPWEKYIGFQEGMHYLSRYNCVVSAAFNQALRILIPDYKERSTLYCQEAYERWETIVGTPGSFLCQEKMRRDLNMHPFCRGGFAGALRGDQGDETCMMAGRVNDFGTYRCEKELDVCDWDICGSDLCRATTASLQAMADGAAGGKFAGPRLEYCMVEAKGCGDLHCRIVAECREKYPMPEHEVWETFGPVATADQIKFTPDEECLKEPMVFREDCNYIFSNGTNNEVDESSVFGVISRSGPQAYFVPATLYAIKKGIFTEETAKHVIKCCCEAAGKAAFGDFFAKEGLRTWLNVPRSIGDDDGRLMGGVVETYLSCARVPYQVEQFNREGVVLVVDRVGLMANGIYADWCLLPYWYGSTKTLVNAQWSLWEEDSPEGKLRIKIAKKIDKFC